LKRKKELDEWEVKDRDDTVQEEEPPVGQELWGTGIMLVGTKTDFGMTQAELIKLIEEHGGEYHDDAYENTTFMIAGKKTKANGKKKFKELLMKMFQSLILIF